MRTDNPMAARFKELKNFFISIHQSEGLREGLMTNEATPTGQETG